MRKVRNIIAMMLVLAVCMGQRIYAMEPTEELGEVIPTEKVEEVQPEDVQLEVLPSDGTMPEEAMPYSVEQERPSGVEESVEAYAAYNPYPEWQTIGGITTRRCTWYAWKIAYEKVGVALPAWGNGGTWYRSAQAAKMSVGGTARAKSLAVYEGFGGNSFGHVAYVERVDGNSMYVLEGGRTDLASSGGVGTANVSTAIGHVRPGNIKLVGFIYLTNTETPSNMGDGIYYVITNANSKLYATREDNGNVTGRTNSGKYNQTWRFDRLGDGSYKIISAADGKCLDVYGAGTSNGTNVWTFPYTAHPAQQWWVYYKDGYYLLRAKIGNNVLDFSTGSVVSGTNIHMWEPNNTAAQKLEIWNCNESNSTISATVQDSKVSFKWTPNSIASVYNLKVWKNKIWEGDAYAVEWNLTTTEKTLNLPNGTYQAYVDGANPNTNYLKMSNVIQFTVNHTPVVKPEAFKDVKSSDWFYNEVKYVYGKGVMTGTSAGVFSPYNALARAQFATIIYRMEGSPKVSYTKKFADVPDAQWFTTPIIWASNAGIVTGYSNSKLFGTGDNINREQMAVMMYRYAKYKKYNVSQSANLTKYKDVQLLNAYAKEAMQWAVGSGMITGKDSGARLDPRGNASRAECAVIMKRFMEKYK